jgi:hypothetical protein
MDERTKDAAGGEVSRSAPQRWPLLLAPALLLLIGWESVTTWIQHATAVQRQDWEMAAQQLRQHHRPGDAILVAPDWAGPAARAHLGGLLDLELATLSDVDRYARVWELSIRGARHRWLRALEPAQSWQPSRVTLGLYQKPAATVLFDFRDELPRAEVALVGAGRQPCRWNGERFRCTRDRWSWVGVKIGEIDHRPRRCIYAHPHDGSILRISFSNVPLGSALVGYTGIDDYDSRRAPRAAVHLQVLIDDQRERAIRQQNHGGWKRFELDTSERAGARHRVRFEISTEDARYRTFCFHAEVRK